MKKVIARVRSRKNTDQTQLLIKTRLRSRVIATGQKISDIKKIGTQVVINKFLNPLLSKRIVVFDGDTPGTQNNLHQRL